MGMIGNTPAAGLIGGGNIQDGSVDTIDIANSAITTAKVADGAVTTAKVTDGNITAAKLASTAVTDKLGYTPVNKAGDTMTGSLTVKRVIPEQGSVGVGKNGSNTFNGWYRIAKAATAVGGYGARGGAEICLYTTGGWTGPGMSKITVFKDYSTAGSLNVESFGAQYITDWRLAMTADDCYLEGYMNNVTIAGDFLFYTTINCFGWDSGGWTLYNETITAGLSSPTAVLRCGHKFKDGTEVRRLYGMDSGVYPAESIRAGAWYLHSAFDNPTAALLRVDAAGAVYGNLICEVEVAQMPWATSGIGNVHVGSANWGNGGSLKNVTGMSLRSQPSSSTANVGSLSWSGNTLQYTTNRASNYDGYMVSIRVHTNSLQVYIPL